MLWFGIGLRDKCLGLCNCRRGWTRLFLLARYGGVLMHKLSFDANSVINSNLTGHYGNSYLAFIADCAKNHLFVVNMLEQEMQESFCADLNCILAPSGFAEEVQVAFSRMVFSCINKYFPIHRRPSRYEEDDAKVICQMAIHKALFMYNSNKAKLSTVVMRYIMCALHEYKRSLRTKHRKEETNRFDNPKKNVEKEAKNTLLEFHCYKQYRSEKQNEPQYKLRDLLLENCKDELDTQIVNSYLQFKGSEGTDWKEKVLLWHMNEFNDSISVTTINNLWKAIRVRTTNYVLENKIEMFEVSVIC